MSILSKNQFDKLCLSINTIQQQLNEESRAIQNKICLALAKIDCIEQQSQIGINKNSQQYQYEKQCADQILKLNEEILRVKANIEKMHSKYQSDLNNSKAQLLKSIFELEKLSSISDQDVKKQWAIIQQQMTLELDQIQKQYIKQVANEEQQIRKKQSQMLSQINNFHKQILLNRKKIQEDQVKLAQKVQQMKADLQEKVSKIKEDRRNKKINFLTLLESVISKIKQTETIQI